MTQSEIEAMKVSKDKEIAKEKMEHEKEMNREKIAGSIAGKLIPSGSFKLNDLDWYFRLYGNPKVNSNIPDFQQGEEINPHLAKHGYNINGTEAIKVENNPGVYCVEWVPTVGEQGVTWEDTQVTAESGLNESLSRLKSQLEKRNSRITNYSNDTIGRYIVGVVDGPYAMLKLLKTAIDVFDYANAIYPTVAARIVSALGFDYCDFSDNIANYRDDYAKWSAQVEESIPMISDVSFRLRREFCTGKIIRDSNNERAQYVVLAPTHIAEVGEDDVVRYRPNLHWSRTAWLNIMRNNYRRWTKGATWRPFIRDLRGSVDAKYFVTIDKDPNAITTTIDIVDEVLAQFHNLTTYPGIVVKGSGTSFFDSDSLSLRGDAKENLIQGMVGTANDFSAYHPGIMYYDVLFQFGSSKDGKVTESAVKTTQDIKGRFYAQLSAILGRNSDLGEDHILVNQFEDFKEGDVMIDTRFKSTFEISTFPDDSDVLTVRPRRHGTEVVLGIRSVSEEETTSPHLFSGNYSGDGDFTRDAGPEVNISFINNVAPGDGRYYVYSKVLSTTYVNIFVGFDDAHNSELKFLCAQDIDLRIHYSSLIDWFPIIKKFNCSVDEAAPSGADLMYWVSGASIGELDTYTFLSDNLLSRLHKQAAVSEFTIDSNLILAPLS